MRFLHTARKSLHGKCKSKQKQGKGYTDITKSYTDFRLGTVRYFQRSVIRPKRLPGTCFDEQERKVPLRKIKIIGYYIGPECMPLLPNQVRGLFFNFAVSIRYHFFLFFFHLPRHHGPLLIVTAEVECPAVLKVLRGGVLS